VDAGRLLAAIPSVDRLLGADWVKPLLERYSRSFVVASLRAGCDELRAEIRAGRFENGATGRTP